MQGKLCRCVNNGTDKTFIADSLVIIIKKYTFAK